MPDTGLEAITDGLWEARCDLRMMPGFWFNCRMTVIQLPNGELILHSPVRVDDATAAKIDALGTVKYIIAPSLFHHLYVPHARKRWPDAELWAAPKLGKKRPDLTIDHTLGDPMPEAWSGVLDALLIEGCPKLRETVFFHRPTRTLIVTDLVFNIHEPPGALSPWILRAVGAWQRVAQSRLWRTITADRAAAGRSVTQMLDWDFDRLIPAHGRVVHTGAKPKVANGLSWMLSDVGHPLVASA